MNTIKRYYKAVFTAMFLLFTLSACDDFSFPVDEAYNRLFSPVSFETETVASTQVAITFSKVSGAKSYTFEFAKDSLQFTDIVRTEERAFADLQLAEGSTSKYTVLFGQLEGDTRYSLRIKAITTDGTPESKWVTVTFKTRGEQIFTAIQNNEKTDKSVVVRWDAGDVPVTHIVLTDALMQATRVDLTADDMVKKEKLIEGLTGGTVYIAQIFNNTNKRGELTFRTNETVPATGAVFYLDGTEDIVSYIAALTDTDVTLVLPAASVFVADWIDPLTSAAVKSLPLNDNISSITFWGLEGATQARINFTTLRVGAAINRIRFKNVEVHGNSSTADYILNESATRSIAEISFEDSKIHTMRGLVRLQNANNSSVIDKYTMRNCIVSNIGGYGVLHAQNTTAVVSDVSITESTFNTITDAYVFLNTKSNSVVVSECTFYNCLANGRYFFNFNNNVANVPTVFKFENNIVGKFYYTAATPDPLHSARATNPKIVEAFALGSYKTADFVVNTGYPLSGVSEYERSSTDLFVDPANGNFRIKDANFSGSSNAGDPRWR